MKKGLIIALAVVMGLALMGCSKSTVSEVAVGSDNKPLLDADRKPIILQHELTNETAFHHDQKDLKKTAIVNQKPLVGVTLEPGATLKAEGAPVRIEAFVPLAKDFITIVEYQGDVAKVLIAGKEYIMPLALLYSLGWGPNFQRPANAGTNNYQINTQGDGSGVNVSGGNMGNTTTTVSPSSTTTTTTTGAEATPAGTQ